jgi:O-antigen/teichoic acid export membrane protein
MAPPSQLRADILQLVSAQVWYKISDALLAVGLARMLPADGLGRLLWSLSLARSLTPIAGLQAEPLVARRIARAPELAREQAGGLLALRLFTTPPFLVAVGLGAWWRPDLWPAIVLVALSIAAEDTWHAIGATFIARGRTDLTVRVGLSAQALLLGGSLLAAALTGSWTVVAAAMLLRSVIALALGWEYADRPPWIPVPGLLQGVAPFTLAGLVATLAEQADTVLVGTWAPWEEVAAWSLALRVGWASLFLPQAVAMVLFPIVAVERRPLLRDTALLALAGAVVAVVMVAVAPWVTPYMFGELASTTNRLITGLAPSLPFAYAVQLLRPSLQARGWERATLLSQLLCTAVGLAAAAALLPEHGAIGAAWARTLSGLAQTAALLLILWMDTTRR